MPEQGRDQPATTAAVSAQPASMRARAIRRAEGVEPHRAFYFKWGNSHRKFRHIDLYVYERLERFMRIKHGPRGHFGARRFYDVYPRLRLYHLEGTSPRRAVHA